MVLGDHQTTRKRTRPDWMMLETRSEKLGRGQRTVYEQAKTPELQNTVMDDRGADPQRVKRAVPLASNVDKTS